MYKEFGYLLAFFSLVISVETSAQSANIPEEIDTDSIRLKQIGLAVPDAVAFEIALRATVSLAESDYPTATDILRLQMGLSFDRAQTLLVEMQRALHILDKEKAAYKEQMYCEELASGLTDDELYQRFGAVDDMSDVIANKHFVLFQSGLSTDEAEQLQQFIETKKPGMGRVKMDHKKLYQKRQADPHIVVDEICIAAESTKS